MASYIAVAHGTTILADAAFGPRALSTERAAALSALARLHESANNKQPAGVQRALRASLGSELALFAWVDGEWSGLCVCSAGGLPTITAYALLQGAVEEFQRLYSNGAEDDFRGAVAFGLSERFEPVLARLGEEFTTGRRRDKVERVREQLASAREAVVQNARRLENRDAHVVDLLHNVDSVTSGTAAFAQRADSLKQSQKRTLHAFMALLILFSLYLLVRMLRD